MILNCKVFKKETVFKLACLYLIHLATELSLNVIDAAVSENGYLHLGIYFHLFFQVKTDMTVALHQSLNNVFH